MSRERGTPMQVSADRYTAEYFAEPAPDGRTLAFTARGMAGSQWCREGHSHLGDTYGDSGDIVWVISHASVPLT